MLPLLILGAPLNSQAQTADADEFAYLARPGDTLIGLGRRLLRDPKRWPEVQQRNHIGNEYRIKPGSTIRIPYGWLKVSAETASVTKVAGAVTRSGQPVTAGQSLDQGSQVETGPDGSVAIDLADGSQIVLHKSSSLRLSEMQRVDGVPNAHDIQVQLPAGHAETHVKPHRDVGRFEIVTPTAALAVRGTIFRASALTEGAVTTETLEGVVAVSASGQTVTTEADFGTRVERGAPPLKPVPLLPAPELSAVPGRTCGHSCISSFQRSPERSPTTCRSRMTPNSRHWWPPAPTNPVSICRPPLMERIGCARGPSTPSKSRVTTRCSHSRSNWRPSPPSRRRRVPTSSR